MVKLKKILSGLNYLSLYLLVLICLDILMLNIPLTKIFGYEFAAANSIILVILAGFYTISLLNTFAAFKPEHKKIAKRLFLAFSILFVIPLLIAILNSLLTINCSMKDGLEFYFVLALPAEFVGLFIASLSFSLLKKFPRILFVFLFIAIISIPFVEYYFNPQIYFYNPIFGFFPVQYMTKD